MKYTNKSKSVPVRVRITEDQFRRLCDSLIEEQVNKSQFIRESIDEKIESVRRRTLNDSKPLKVSDILDTIFKNEDYGK
jgi:hypothetical protein